LFFQIMKGTYFNADGTSLEVTAVKAKGGLYDLKKDDQVIVAGCVASEAPKPGHVVLSVEPDPKAEAAKAKADAEAAEKAAAEKAAADKDKPAK
jgi:membrane protein involved in colicin uptake